MLILASNSPRRKQLLDLTGWDYRIVVPTADEQVRQGEPPDEYVRRLALEKAQAASALLLATDRQQAIILAADTTVVDVDAPGSPSGEILGKPADPTEAWAMLRRLRGRLHRVYTGLAALRLADGAVINRVVSTDVWMRNYSDAEIERYVASGDPLDKAGAYAIQHAGFQPVQNLQGCYANVMGLPVCHLAQMLAEFGLEPRNSIPLACQEALDRPCQIFHQVLQGQATPLSS
jgi:MAF protein